MNEDKVGDVYWMTGLPCSGKTTIAKNLKDILLSKGYNVLHLDGDDLRSGLCEDLGFSYEDRKENLRRASHITKIFSDNGYPVITSFISPTNELRGMIKDILGERMKLIYVECDLEMCKRRDVKGMYALAEKGNIKDFTGVSSDFLLPNDYDLKLNTEKTSLEDCVQKIVKEFNL